MTSASIIVEFTLSLPSKTEYLSLASNFISLAVKTCGGTPQTCTEVALAADEALTNIMQHAYGGRTDRAIDVMFKGSKDAVELRILHRGKQIDPDRLMLPDLKNHLTSKCTRGLGLHIMAKLMNEIEFSTTEDQKEECRLVKFLNRPGTASTRPRLTRKAAGDKT